MTSTAFLLSWAITSAVLSYAAFFMAYRFLLVRRKGEGRLGLIVGALEAMLAITILTGILSVEDVSLVVRPLIIIGQVALAGLLGWLGRVSKEAIVETAAYQEVEKEKKTFGLEVEEDEEDEEDEGGSDPKSNLASRW